MSRIISLVVVMVLAFSLHDRAATAASPTTMPSLEQQNADLKALANDYAIQLSKADARILQEMANEKALQSQVDLLNAELKLLKRGIGVSQKIEPSPYRLTSPFDINPQMMPPGTNAFQYNGRNVYVEPLAHDDVLSIVPSPTAGAKSGPYQMTQGTLIDNRAKP